LTNFVIARGLHHRHAKREPPQRVIQEANGRTLVARVVDFQYPKACAVVDGGELIEPLARAGDALEKLDVDLQAVGPSFSTIRSGVGCDCAGAAGTTAARVSAHSLGKLSCLATTVSTQIASYAIVPNTLDGTVSIFDVVSGTVVLTPHIGGAPTSVAVTPDGRRA
jgi:DNA-binding beta-propeller fold protein YncE